MLYRKTIIFLFASLLLFASSPAQYQGRIDGRVTDGAGTALEKVEVVIVSSKLGSQRFELKTDRNGRFTQIGLSPGFYVLNFKKAGFAPRAVEVKVSIAEATKFEVQLEPAAAEAERTMSESDRLFLKGNKLYGEDEFPEAVTAYKEAVELSPSQWAYHFNLGLAYKKMNRAAEAREAFKRAADLNPDSFSVNKELAESLARGGRYDEAKAFYRKALEVSADDPDIYYNLGLCEVSTGETGAALESFSRSVALKPDYADAYFQLGTLFINQNRTEEAVESLKKFLELEPGHEKAGVAQQLLDYLRK